VSHQEQTDDTPYPYMRMWQNFSVTKNLTLQLLRSWRIKRIEHTCILAAHDLRLLGQTPKAWIGTNPLQRQTKFHWVEYLDGKYLHQIPLR